MIKNIVFDMGNVEHRRKGVVHPQRIVRLYIISQNTGVDQFQHLLQVMLLGFFLAGQG